MSDAVLDRQRGAHGIDRLTGRAMAWAIGSYARFAAAIGAALFALYVLLVSATVVVLPDANWDMLAYLAAAEENAYPDPAALHDFAYGALRNGVAAGDYAALVGGDPYREHMANDPVAFHSMLPMYRVKALYAETVSVLSQVVSPVAAIRTVSVLSTLLFGVLALMWLRAEGALALAPVLAGVMMAAGFAEVARVGSPDMLASALLLGGAFAFRSKREGAAAFFLFLAFLARPDNLIFLAAMTVLLGLARQWSWGVTAAFAASLVVYSPLSHWAGHPGWWPHLYFSSIAQQLDMDGFNPAFSVMLYAKAFVLSAVRAVTFNAWVGIALLALAGWFATERAGIRFGKRAGVLFAALLLGIAGKFVVFPIHDTRIYFPNLIPPFLLLSPLLLAAFAGRRVNASTIG